MKSLERPYGLVADSGKSSVIGTVAGSPYTVADDENTTAFTPASAISSNSAMLPAMLLS